MANLFHPEGYLGCSPFESPSAEDETRVELVFFRKTLAQNSAGELIQTWTSTITARGDLVPNRGQLVRYLHGELAEVPFSLHIFGVQDVRNTDRTYIPQPFTSAILVEVTNVNFYGVEVMEVDLQWVR